MSIVGLVLLIACVNLANLLLPQSARREKEIGLRAALGASRNRLLRQLLTESLVLSVLAAIVGLAIAYGGRRALWSYRPPFIQENDLDLSLDSHVLLFTLVMALFTALFIGLAPAVKSATPNLTEILRTGGRSGTVSWTRSPLRSMLVVSEIALALVALIGAGLFIRSMQNAQRIDPGFESEKLFMMAFDLDCTMTKAAPRNFSALPSNKPGVDPCKWTSFATSCSGSRQPSAPPSTYTFKLIRS